MNVPAKSTNAKQMDSVAMNLGIYLMSLATVGAGILDLIWRDFDPGHQPFGGLDYYIPDHAIFASISGLWLIFAGSAMLWPRAARLGRFATAAIYFAFGLLSLPHFNTMFHKYGVHFSLIVGVVGQIFLQLLVVAGCLVIDTTDESVTPSWSKELQMIARCIFGLGGILTGVGHLQNTRGLVHMIPKGMPLGASFWIVTSGIGFILAGIAILAGMLNLLAARLLALMLFIFQIILVPIIFEYPHLHQAWGATAFNLAVAGAVCIFSASLSIQKTRAHAAVARQVAEV